jgi:hypothetical protein
MGLVAKSYLRKGLLKYEEMRKYLTIYEKVLVININLQPIPSEFPYIWGKFSFLFIRVCHEFFLVLIFNRMNISGLPDGKDIRVWWREEAHVLRQDLQQGAQAGLHVQHLIPHSAISIPIMQHSSFLIS